MKVKLRLLSDGYRRAARFFLRGGGWSYGSKSLDKEKLLVIRIAKESTYCVDKQFDSTHHENWGSFQLNCHRVSLICFPDNRKTRQPWLHVLAEFCLDLWFFLLSESIFLMSTFPSLLQILRDASNFSAKNLFSFAFFKFFELILPTYQGPYSWQHQVQTHATHHLQSDPSWNTVG